MQKIINNKDKFEIQAIDAIIDNDTIIPGKSAKKVNIEASYKKMKRVNKYTESLYVFDYKLPDISLKNNYDKLIISGNPINKNISILVKLNDLEILKKLKDNKSLNFILNESFINENYYDLKNISNNIVILENTNLINLDIIDYCYSLSFNSYCTIYNKYTIKPNFITNNYFYNTYKYIENGSILAYNIINESNINDLSNIITYIKTLNYHIVSLDELIKE
ncbi:MAG: hypothetical protein IJ068_03375 [Bacilli bacterium]|nr:hypothetical protein [Bacilli bacterium]